jgi:hypothetical protein
MATLSWIGGAAKRAQVQTYLFGGTWEADDIARLVIGNKTVDVTAGSTVTATVVSTVVTAWNALSATDYPEFAEITASANTTTLTLTKDTAGEPFTCTITPLEANGSAADAQTIGGAGVATTGTTATTNTGPEDVSVPANWSGGAIPVNGDTAIVDKEGARLKYSLYQSAITLASLRILAKDVEVGLPKTKTGTTPYPEYRPDFWKIGATSSYTNTNSGRLKLDHGSTVVTYEQDASGASRETNVPAVLLKGTHASSVWHILGGAAGIAFFAGETATLLTLNVNRGTNVVCGTGCTIGTVNNYGGTLLINSAIATALNHPSANGGTTTLEGSGGVSLLTMQSGKCVYNTTGTLAGDTVLGGSAQLTFDEDQKSKSVTEPIQIYNSAVVFSDSNAVIDGGAALEFHNCLPTVRLAPDCDIIYARMD